ncbi:rhomboid-like protease [Klebsormidium nitens]|uniref:RHOMBOID-like protein n=1 Tax=Klebsormidium nitens TaxID=105231 RepID=A0A1Y1HNZ1_KLENI|nr:rhomboid-like protease [Klebsormidium nitens]|eukprot:GAQ79753.1 rhomboid-like protease [Klebsormidium nitens]
MPPVGSEIWTFSTDVILENVTARPVVTILHVVLFQTLSRGLKEQQFAESGWVDSLLSLRRRASSRYLMTGNPNPPANSAFETVVETIPGQAMSSSDANLDDVKRPPQINTSKPPPNNAANASGGSVPVSNNPLGNAYPGAHQGSPFASDTGRSRLSSGSVLERSISIVSTIAHFVTDEYPLERLRAQSGGATRNGDEEQGGSPQNNEVSENGIERGVQGASPQGRGSGLESRLPHSRAYNETRGRERGSPYAQDGGRSARSQRGGGVNSPRSPFSPRTPRSPLAALFSPRAPIFDENGRELSKEEVRVLSIEEWQRQIVEPDGTPKASKVRLFNALERKKAGPRAYARLSDRVADELFITGQAIFDWFTPRARRHSRFFTWAFAFVCFAVFFFMAGEYPAYLQNVRYAGQTEKAVQVGKLELNVGPSELTAVVFRQESWRMFDFGFLRIWGGRYAPAIKRQHQWSRWFTSIFVHESFNHVTSNMLLWLVLGLYLERKYATWRIALLWLLSGLGGNFFSALFEDKCTLVVGASGAVFGMVGLFVGDFMLNFETIRRPVLRLLSFAIFLLYFVITVATAGSTSHFSHVGGFLAGLFPAFLYLPNFKHDWWEAALPPAGLLAMAFFFVVCPAVVYNITFANLPCS